MKQIYLIRHGRQSSKLCNVDVSLDDAGRRQADLVADRLISYKLEALYASGLKRAQETAQAISQATGLPVRCVESFHEIEFGELTGLSNEEWERNALYIWNLPAQVILYILSHIRYFSQEHFCIFLLKRLSPAMGRLSAGVLRRKMIWHTPVEKTDKMSLNGLKMILNRYVKPPKSGWRL